MKCLVYIVSTGLTAFGFHFAQAPVAISEKVRIVITTLCGSVAEWLGRWTCDQ